MKPFVMRMVQTPDDERRVTLVIASAKEVVSFYRICNTWEYARETQRTRVRQSRSYGKVRFRLLRDDDIPNRWEPRRRPGWSSSRLWRSRDISHEGNFYRVCRWGYSLPRLRLRSSYALLFREARNKISKLERCSRRKLNMSTRSLERNGTSRRYTGVLKRAFKRNVQHNDTCKKFAEK